jgi:hypothetical protein
VVKGNRHPCKGVDAESKVGMMFNPTHVVIEAFASHLRAAYERTYGMLEPSYPGAINFVSRLAFAVGTSLAGAPHAP